MLLPAACPPVGSGGKHLKVSCTTASRYFSDLTLVAVGRVGVGLEGVASIPATSSSCTCKQSDELDSMGYNKGVIKQHIPCWSSYSLPGEQRYLEVALFQHALPEEAPAPK